MKTEKTARTVEKLKTRAQVKAGLDKLIALTYSKLSPKVLILTLLWDLTILILRIL